MRYSMHQAVNKQFEHSAPCALASNNEPKRPRTRMASPKVQKITSGRRAIATQHQFAPSVRHILGSLDRE